MDISVKAKYGVIAALSLAKQANQGPIQIRQIASECDIPHQFLEQIMGELKKNNLVRSFRGSKGGYTLGASPDKIVVRDIVLALDGPITLSSRTCGCPELAQLWRKVEEQILDALDVPLSLLVAESYKLNNTLTYAI